MKAGLVNVILTYFTPISLDNLLRQSLPFSYLDVQVVATDDTEHQVELFTDIGLQFVTNEADAACQWTQAEVLDLGGGTEIQYLDISRVTPLVFQESNDRAEYGQITFAYQPQNASINTSYAIGKPIGESRNEFVATGKLAGVVDTKFRSMNEDWPTFAFAHDLGPVGKEAKSLRYVLGHTREPALQYVTPSGIEIRHEFWRSHFSTVAEAVRLSFLCVWNRDINSRSIRHFSCSSFIKTMRLHRKKHGTWT